MSGLMSNQICLPNSMSKSRAFGENPGNSQKSVSPEETTADVWTAREVPQLLRKIGVIEYSEEVTDEIRSVRAVVKRV